MARPSSATYDLRDLNDSRNLRATRIALSVLGLSVLATGLYFGAIRIVAITLGGLSSSRFDNLGFDVFILAVGGGMGTVILFTSFVGGSELAVSLMVSEDEGFSFTYPSGSVRSYYWNDPKMRVRFMDYIVQEGQPHAGRRRIVLWQLWDRTAIPSSAFDSLCGIAQLRGISLMKARYSPLHGTLVTMTGVGNG